MAAPAETVWMRTLAIGNKRSAQVGLSLIEMLVVLVIMGLVTGLVVLTAPSRTPPATTAAERLRGELTALRMRAITEGTPIGISAPGGIIRAHQYRNGAWSPGTPLPRLDQVHTDIELGEQFILPEDTRAAPVLVLEGRRLTPLRAAAS